MGFSLFLPVIDAAGDAKTAYARFSPSNGIFFVSTLKGITCAPAYLRRFSPSNGIFFVSTGAGGGLAAIDPTMFQSL